MESEDVRLLSSLAWEREQYEMCVLVHGQAVYSVVVRMHILTFSLPASSCLGVWSFTELVSWTGSVGLLIHPRNDNKKNVYREEEVYLYIYSDR